MVMRTRLSRTLLALIGCCLSCAPPVAPAAHAAPPDDQIIAVFDEQPVEFDKALADGTQRDGAVRLYRNGQQIERTIALPPLPANMRDARRILATLIVEPALLQQDDKVRPVDPWTRLGSVTIAAAGDTPASRSEPASQPTTRAAATTQPSASLPSGTQPDYPATTVAPGSREIELMRFVTPFGGPATYTADLTAFAPLLAGEHSIRVWISTWKQPAWKVTLTLSYTTEGVGYRRPIWAAPIFNSEVTAEKRTIKASVDVPKGLSRPRLHLLTTGHATDGAGGDEFISRSHVLRIDGIEVARWRPWSERGGPLRQTNPTSGRMEIDGRPLWASDLDRSGWNPGLLVEPMQIPLPELTAGRHAIELEILNIRPKDQSGYGYWRVSAIVVCDEPWPPGDEISGPP
ncbi:MAG TPA: peptide-N-glycosidase F-related protein [Phycisphaerales bacterium]|nr:peptide-N-glycosidase F-related protein [Phycisphaerales bacterium]